MLDDYHRRINYLEKKYSETNISKGEVLSNESVRRINRNYDKNQQKRRVDAILNNIKNKDSIKEEVQEIIKNVQLKSLCYNCSEEQIIAVIILYVQRARNNQYRIDRTNLWRVYELSWTKYSLIIERLLKWTREQQRIKTNKLVDLNEDMVRW